MVEWLTGVVQAFSEHLVGTAVDKAASALKNVYDPLARSAAKLTADDLKARYGDRFVDVWGSMNFVEALPSHGPDELKAIMASARQGQWKYDPVQLSRAISDAVKNTLPQLVDHADEFVELFMKHFLDLLKNDSDALMKRIFERQEEVFANVVENSRTLQQLDVRMTRLESTFQSVEITPVELALRSALSKSQLEKCEEVLKRCELHIARREFEEARTCITNIGQDVQATKHGKLIGRYYNMQAQIESWSGANCSPSAIEYLKTAEVYIPDDPILKVNVAVYYCNIGEIDKARQYLAIPSDQQTFANYFNQKGLLAIHDGDRPLAKKCFDKAVELDSKFWEAHANLGRLHVEDNELNEAEKVYLDLKKNNPQHLSVYIGLGNLHFTRAERCIRGSQEEKAELESAKKFYEEGVGVVNILKIDQRYVASDVATLLGNLGSVESSLDDLNAGLSHLKQSRDLDPNQANTRFNLAQVFHRLGNFKEAISEYEKAVDLGRSDPMTRTNLGSMYLASYLREMDESCLSKAETLLLQVVDEVNCNLAVENLCTIYFLQNRLADVKAICEKVLAIAPNCVHALSQLTLYYEENGDIEKAAKLRQTILKIDPENFDANYDLGLGYFREKRWKEAIQPLTKCTKPTLLSSNLLPKAFILLANCYKALGMDQNAFETLGAGLRRYPNDPLLNKETARLANVSPEKPPSLFVPIKQPRLRRT